MKNPWPNNNQLSFFCRQRMEVLDHNHHMVVYHLPKHSTIEIRQFVRSDETAIGIVTVEFLKPRQVFAVHFIPVGRVHIPKDIARTDALPQEDKLLLVGTVGQFVALAYIRQII